MSGRLVQLGRALVLLCAGAVWASAAQAQSRSSVSIKGLGEQATRTEADRRARGLAVGDALSRLLERFPESAAAIGIKDVRVDQTRKVLVVHAQVGLNADFVGKLEAALTEGAPPEVVTWDWTRVIGTSYVGRYFVSQYFFYGESAYPQKLGDQSSSVVTVRSPTREVTISSASVPIDLRFNDRFGVSRQGPRVYGTGPIHEGCSLELITPVCALNGDRAMVLVYSDRYLLRRYSLLGDPPVAGWWLRLHGDRPRGPGAAALPSGATRLLGVLEPTFTVPLTYEIPIDFLGSGTALSIALQGALPGEAEVCLDAVNKVPTNAPRSASTIGDRFKAQRSRECIAYLANDLRRLTGQNWRWVRSPWPLLADSEVWERAP